MRQSIEYQTDAVGFELAESVDNEKKVDGFTICMYYLNDEQMNVMEWLSPEELKTMLKTFLEIIEIRTSKS